MFPCLDPEDPERRHRAELRRWMDDSPGVLSRSQSPSSVPIRFGRSVAMQQHGRVIAHSARVVRRTRRRKVDIRSESRLVWAEWRRGMRAVRLALCGPYGQHPVHKL
jgi:hypothetical protein